MAWKLEWEKLMIVSHSPLILYNTIESNHRMGIDFDFLHKDISWHQLGENLIAGKKTKQTVPSLVLIPAYRLCS